MELTKHLSPSYFRYFFRLSQLCTLVVGLFVSVVAQSQPPVLLTENGSTRAIALESVTNKGEPFTPTSSVSFGSDPRTRIAIFAWNAQLAASQTIHAYTADVQDASGRFYPLVVESAVPLANAPGVTMLVVRLNDALQNVGDVLLRIGLHGMFSNRVRIGIGSIGGGPPDDLLPGPTARDTVSPNATVTSPADGVTVSGTITVTASASDNVAVDTTYLIVDGGALSSDVTSPYSYRLDTTKLSNGSHFLFVRAWDASGNVGDSRTVVFTVANGSTPAPTPTPTPTPTPAPPPTPTQTRFKVLHWNVAHGRGTDNLIDHNRQATWMANMQVDLISLNEVPPGDKQIYVNLLQQKTGVTWYSHWMPATPEQQVGQQILSRHPILSTDGLFLTFGRSIARVRVSIGGRTVNFFSTHLSFESSSWRFAQIAEIHNWISGFGETRIVAGDFNLWDALPEYQQITPNFFDAWIQAVNAGTAVSYPDNPEGKTRGGKIDFIFYSKHAANLALIETRLPDLRDLNNKNVVVFVGNSNDWGVRPSDHNLLVSTFELR